MNLSDGIQRRNLPWAPDIFCVESPYGLQNLCYMRNTQHGHTATVLELWIQVAAHTACVDESPA